MHSTILVVDFLQEGQIKDHLKKNWKRYATAAVIGGGLSAVAANMQNKNRDKQISQLLDNTKSKLLDRAKSHPNYNERKHEVDHVINSLTVKSIPKEDLKLVGDKHNITNRAIRGAIGGIGASGAIGLYKYMKSRKKGNNSE